MTSPIVFYVYILARPDGRPFYVGKGAGDRIYRHERKARSGCPCHKCCVIRKIWRSGGEVQRYTVFTTENEQEAFAYEIAQIALIGRKNLTNLTDGGEGSSGFTYTMSPAECQRRSRWATQRWQSSEERAAQSQRVRAARQKPESRAKSSAANRLRYQNPVARQRAAERMRAIMADPGKREQMIAASAKVRQTPEARQRSSEIAKQRWSTPEGRQQRSEQAKVRYTDPEERRAMSEACRATWADPVKRAERLEKRRLAAERRKQGS